MTEFNPYREWLGIDSNKPTYYQLIGVSPSEEDDQAIRKLAKNRLEQLERVETSSPAIRKLKQKLNLRIKRAAKCLLTPDSRIQYDRKLLSKNQAEIDHVAVAVKPQLDLSKQEAVTTDPLAVAIDAAAPPTAHISKRYKTKQKRNSTLFICAVLGLVSIAGLGYLLATQTKAGRTALGLPTYASPDSEESPTFDDSQAEPLPMNASDFSKAEKTTERDQTDANTRATIDNSFEEPNPSDDTTIAKTTKEDLRQLEEALTSAHQALTNRDPSLAKEILQGARSLPKREVDEAKYARLLRLADYVEQYWQALDDALDRLGGGSEITVSDNRMIVVEIDDEQLVVRSNGQNKKLQRNNLPLPLAIALADSWFDQNAASTKVFRGAMMAVTPNFDADEARALWTQAVDQGAQIGDLEDVLDDDYNLVQ